ncbi:MAG: MarC family protein [Nitrosomonadales bacterium]|nr:MarC family protein [Nitrosomonadales bacterium]
MDFVATTLLLFIVLDPLGNIPIYLSQLRVVPEHRRRFVALRELGIAYLLLLFFFFAGSAFMKLLSLDIAAVNIAGAVILFLIALRMVFPSQEGLFGNIGTSTEPLIVPLAVPAVAGPGAMSVVLLLREANPDQSMTLFAALTVAWLISAAILGSASRLQRILRDEGIVAMERLMGLVLVIIAIQMFLDALRLIGAIDV